MEEKKVLGVKINNFFKIDEIYNLVSIFLNKNNGSKIYTPNPEMLVKANKDKLFKNVLNRADLNICDGMGISFFYNIKRFPGVDFMLFLCELAEKNNSKIFLLGSQDEKVIDLTKNFLKKKYPNLLITGSDKGILINENIKEKTLEFDEKENNLLLQKINNSEADILFVAFGMGKQEKWIDEYLIKLPKVKIAIGVGGSFDYISGEIVRAPLFLRKLGLEWLFRLIRQPKRLKRIFNAVFVFTFLSLKNKIIKNNL